MSLLKKFYSYYEQELIEKPYGFIAYQINEDSAECLITELFIEEEVRGEGKALEICQAVEKAAREKGCKILTCNIWPKKHTIAHTNWLLLRYLKFGFSVTNAKEGAIVMCKGLGK